MGVLRRLKGEERTDALYGGERATRNLHRFPDELRIAIARAPCRYLI